MHLALFFGTFFFLEIQPGVELDPEASPGPGVAVEAGGGGAWAHGWPRLFLVTRFAHAVVSEGPRASAVAPDFTSRRTFDDITGGLRVLLPLLEPLRVYGDVLGGGTTLHTDVSRIEMPSLTNDSLRPVMQLAIGVQWRLHANFSVGVRLQQTWVGAATDALEATIGRRLETDRTSLAATLATHF